MKEKARLQAGFFCAGARLAKDGERLQLSLEHDLFRKPVSTFRDHALTDTAQCGKRVQQPIAHFSDRAGEESDPGEHQ
jgi:hypothetical protein